MPVPADRQYTAEHEWFEAEGDVARIGITDYAADALGDIVYVDLPDVGATLEAGAVCGEIESTKSVSELFSPADGVVLAVNDAVAEAPETVNAEPYGAGWLFTMKVAASPDLLGAEAYEALTQGSMP